MPIPVCCYASAEADTYLAQDLLQVLLQDRFPFGNEVAELRLWK